MFHPALWKLLRLQWRGQFRQFTQSLRTIRGLFQLAFMIGIFGYMAFSMFMVQVFSSQHAPLAQALGKPADDILSLGLFLFTFYSILFSTGEATVYFTASEVAFLFPAPVSRRQLLAYQLMKSLFGLVAISLMFTCMAASQFRMIPARFIAVFLTMWFLSLLMMNVAFVRQVAEEKLHVLIRRLLAIAIGVLILAAANQAAITATGTDFADYAKALRQSTICGLLLAPFQIFVRAIRAADWATFFPSAAIVLVVDLGLLFLAFRLDALSLEAALAISEKLTARLKLMQTKGVWQALGASSPTVARRKIPLPPFWAGVGPVVWQRMTTTFRASSKLLWLLLSGIIGVAVVVYLGRSSGPPGMAPAMGVVAQGYLTFLICLSMQNDIERVGYLKSLPIRSTSIVLGDLIGLPILISAAQSLFILAEACFFLEFAAWLVCAAMLTLPINFLMFGIDKLVFYVYPTRMVKASPGDFQAAGKQMIFMILKMLMLGAAVVPVAIATAPVAIILESPLAAVSTAGLILMIECAALVPLLTLAFNKFDPSVTRVS